MCRRKYDSAIYFSKIKNMFLDNRRPFGQVDVLRQPSAIPYASKSTIRDVYFSATFGTRDFSVLLFYVLYFSGPFEEAPIYSGPSVG
jgi:hypothetical protein